MSWLKKYGWCFLLAVLLSGKVAYAQQDAQFSQYIFNGLILNPAYAGSKGTLAANLFYRNQWTGFDGAPVTQTFSIHTPAGRNRYGFGLTASNDRIGYVNQNWINISYAYRIRFKRSDLAMGLQGGILNYRINWADAQVMDPNDFLLGNNAQNILLPNVGAGVYYSSERFYAGLSIPHILNSELINANTSTLEVARLYRHFFLTSGIVLGKSTDFKVKPSVLVKYVPGTPVTTDFNLMFLLKERWWLGAGYRSGDALTFMFDFGLTPQLRLGYAYDYTLSELSDYHNGTHEFVIGYQLIRKNTKLKSPRYF